MYSVFLRGVVFFSILVACLAGSSLARAEEVSSMMNKIERLERQLSTLERQVYRGEVSVPKVPAGPVSQGQNPSVFNAPGKSLNASEMQTLEQEVQRLTSSLEEATHKIDLQGQEIKVLKNDVEFRISELESQKEKALVADKKEPSSDAKKKPKVVDKKSKDLDAQRTEKKNSQSSSKKSSSGEGEKAAGVSALKEKSSSQNEPIQEDSEEDFVEPEVISEPEAVSGDVAEEQYKTSLDFLKKKEYGPALKGFESFLEHHKNNELAGNAQYWIGEAHFAMNNYSKASVAFLTAYKDYPKNTKRPDSLLKLGQSLSKLGKKKEACATLQKLLTDFPNASSAVRKMAQTENSNNGCTP
ncbi:MAG: tol-pal system protein YbgF [Alphaproteobacteria bacterium 16-39-46]|nr:MAG: tol-pal system protein YbgF [Alphaproteobacteria bacterium 16-39-46]OZA42673.1 MAG: tol-pal system protein YbgF [Alphaproteobacteria bacterium 17-39-52]HQS84362.1 tol-pal system protein YbgF [Alphaproteobacteria bacterium]HQS94192.1 tol-pal system protein YbgF [Alphaproteobacteria bacterium]